MHRQGPSAHTVRWRRVSRSPGAVPASPPRVRAPMAARPMATPAWGIRANPRYLRISLGLVRYQGAADRASVFSYDSGKKIQNSNGKQRNAPHRRRGSGQCVQLEAEPGMDEKQQEDRAG